MPKTYFTRLSHSSEIGINDIPVAAFAFIGILGIIGLLMLKDKLVGLLVKRRDARKEGVNSSYYRNGQLHKETTWKSGKKDGLYREYFRNGQLKTKMIYKNGLPHGPFERHFESGKLKEEGAYQDDQGPYKAYYESGQLKEEGFCNKDGEQEGLCKGYYENGQLKYEGVFKGGDPAGEFKNYNKDGSLSQ